MLKINFLRIKKQLFSGLLCIPFSSVYGAKTLIDYFLPMPIVQPLRSDKWGCAAVGKRDIYNGMEDTANKSYSYWDGPIIKGPDGKYHMFASRWGQSGGHWAWLSSVGIHAVSESIMGPYVDKGMTWPSNSGGKGHNLTILQLKDGTYASVVSDTRQGDFFTASSLDGPWTFAGTININGNGFNKPSHIANLSIIIRPDNGKFMIVERGGQIMISEGGLTGPYMIQGNSVYNTVNLPNLEDPVLWYSGGYYHIVVNSWSEKKAYHLRSKNGIDNWTNEGLAFDPRSDFLRYSDGTVNHWCKIERPGVYIENGHITHWTFSVIDSEKENDKGNDDHNSKVIVVPFDGAAFDGEIIPEHRDTVYNGKFMNSLAGWTLNVWEGSAAGIVENGECKVEVSSIGTENHQIQLIQSGLILKQGNYYKVSFDAYTASSRMLEVNVEMKDDPWTAYLSEPINIDLTTNKKTYSFTFKMNNSSDSSGRLSFNMGGSTGTVFLDNITIQNVNETKYIPVMNRHINIDPVVKYEGSVLQIELNSEKEKQLIVGVYDLKGSLLRIKTNKYRLKDRQIWVSDLSELPKGIYVAGLKCGGKVNHRVKFLHHN